MRTRMLWLAATGGWFFVALVSTVQTLDMASGAGRALDWSSLLRTQLASAVMWIPLTVAIVVVVRRHPLERGRRLRSLGVYALVVAAVIVLRALGVWLLDPWIGWYGELPDFGTILATSLRNNLVMAWLLVAVAHAVYWFEGAQRGRARVAELESGLARARLDALTARLNPHFLFNALNAIAELVHRDPAAADRMTVGLAALLRQSLERSETHEIALRDELALLARYVEIERVRMPDRLRFEQAVDDAALECRVPPLLLQPLVENAIVHGVARRTTPGTVRLEVRLADDRLHLQVDDDGGSNDPEHRGHGIGLDNTRARLQCLYGDAGALTLERTATGGTSAMVTLPARPIQERSRGADDSAHDTKSSIARTAPPLGALGTRA
jgi:signal transduction histidine kinase